MEIVRCSWADSSPEMSLYHDTVWGRPEHDDHQLFKKLILDGFQAGLSWSTIIMKMDALTEAFDDFLPECLVTYDEEKVEELMQDAGIIRNRSKIKAAIHNAKRYYVLCEEHGSLNDFLWRYVDYRPIENRWPTVADVPATTELSIRIAKDLKALGFKYVGPTIIYAYMQAIGMVNDHLATCDYEARAMTV